MALLKSGVFGSDFCFSITLADFEQVNTPALFVDQVPWRYLFIRKDNAVNLCLYCDYKNSNDEWWIEAEGRLKIISSKEEKPHAEVKLAVQKFTDTSRMSRLISFMKYEDLTAPENGYIQNGRISLECTIISKPLVKEACPLSPVVHCTSRQFTVRIKNVSKMTEVTSEKYNLRGINWCVKFGKSQDQLSMYLSKDVTDQHFALTVAVTFKAKLLSFNEHMNSFENHMNHCYPVDSVYGRGWSSFLDWDTFVDKDKQYVQNDVAFFVISIDVGPLKPIVSTLNLMLKEKVLPAACPICLKQLYGEGVTDIIATGCGHLFCDACIRSSIDNSPNCPLCNALVLGNEFRKIYL